MSDWKLDSAALDRYIMGNYGEDQFDGEDEEETPQQCEILQSPNGENGDCQQEGTYTCDDCGARMCWQHTFAGEGKILCSPCYGVQGMESPRKAARS